MSPKNDIQMYGASVTTTRKPSKGFTIEEKAADKARIAALVKKTVS